MSESWDPRTWQRDGGDLPRGPTIFRPADGKPAWLPLALSGTILLAGALVAFATRPAAAALDLPASSAHG